MSKINKLNNKFRKLAVISTLSLTFCGCAILHHVQIGQINNLNSDVQVPFEVMVSETGVSTQEIGRIAKATRTRAGDGAGKIAEIVGLFQMGNRTGNPVYDDHYAEKLIYEIYQRCPSGKVSGLASIRETRKYPVISGEIVKVKGFCLQPRSTKVTQTPVTHRSTGEI